MVDVDGRIVSLEDAEVGWTLPPGLMIVFPLDQLVFKHCCGSE